MTAKKLTVRTVLLASMLSTVMIRQVELVPTSEFRTGQDTVQSGGTVLLVNRSDDEGPPPCTVASPCESWF